MRQRIIDSAWELFYEKGYDETTIMDIVQKSGVAKGSFYYHFKGKDTLLNTLASLLDRYYEELAEELPGDMNSFDKLMYLNYRVHSYMERIDYKLLANQYATQLTKSEGSNLLDQNRFYFRLIYEIVEEGQKRGELRVDKSVQEIVRYYSMCERALVTDWCMNNGEYSLGEFSREYMPIMFGSIRA
ncbi:MAG: TetR/AcrR family transcriptional regulator [Eubacteriales bacterium]|nr:TetR/AcrR family transcriptional regulator [Eubacteriales bacterium]